MRPWDEGVKGSGQLELVNSNAKMIRVEAGPGTGKTSGLAHRVQRLVHPDGMSVDGSDILIVAFNRVIAGDLRDVITRLLKDSPHTGDPIIRTVHALCLMVIGATPRPLLPHEREAMLYDVLHLFPGLSAQYKDYSKAEQALRDHEAQLAEHMALWQGARQWLTRHNAILISDLPRLLLDRLKAGDYEATRYEHVIIDEFQDLTAGEQALFMKLKKPDGSVLALGDSKQSIYRFRGNDRDGLSKLGSLNPSATITDIPMQDCFRCPAGMVDAANALMNLYPPPMACGNQSAANIHLVHWKSPQAEAKGLSQHIADNIAAHPEERHLAMVTRRRFGYMLRDALKAIKPELSIDLGFSESLLETWPVREAFIFFCLIADPDAPTWRAWLGYKNPGVEGEYKPPKRNADAYLKFLTSTSDSITPPIIELLAAEPRAKSRGTGGNNLWDRATRFLALRDTFPFKEGDNVLTVLLGIFDPARWPGGKDESAVADFEMVRSTCASLVSEVQEAKKEAPLVEQLQAIARRLRYMIATREPFEPLGTSDLKIATLWGAKGMTAEHVYIVGLCNEALPGVRRNDYPGSDLEYVEEQRRLFYVSLTRSRRTLVLSRATKLDVGTAKQVGLTITRPPRGFWADLRISSFLQDIMPLLPPAREGISWSGCGA